MTDAADRLEPGPAWRMLISRLSLRHFQFVTTVAESGSILAAARALNMTQPAVSRAIRDVETMLGTTLFHRQARGVDLTPQGEIFVIHARAALAEMRHAWQGIEDLGRAQVGRLAIGSLPNGASGPLPRALIRARSERPGIHLSVYEGLYQQMIPALRAGDLDIVIGRLRQNRRDSSLTTLGLYRQSWAVLARADHPMAGEHNLPLRALIDLPWILPVATSPIRPMIEGFFLRAGLDLPRNHLETGALGISRTMLLASDMVVCLPQFSLDAGAGMDGLTPLDVALGDTGEEVGLFLRKGHQCTPAETYFIALLRDEAGKMAV